MNKRFGDVNTDLILTDKAQEYYNGDDMISIYQVGNDTYVFSSYPGYESEPLTAEEVNRYLEFMADNIEDEDNTNDTYMVFTDIGIISDTCDTGIDTLEEAEERAKMYVDQGYSVDIINEKNITCVKTFDAMKE